MDDPGGPRAEPVGHEDLGSQQDGLELLVEVVQQGDRRGRRPPAADAAPRIAVSSAPVRSVSCIHRTTATTVCTSHSPSATVPPARIR